MISKCNKKFPSLTAENILFKLLSPTLSVVVRRWQLPPLACHAPHDSLQRGLEQEVVGGRERNTTLKGRHADPVKP